MSHVGSSHKSYPLNTILTPTLCKTDHILLLLLNIYTSISKELPGTILLVPEGDQLVIQAMSPLSLFTSPFPVCL